MGGSMKGKGTVLEYGGAPLGRIHKHSNDRKAMAYWLGFLKGVLASKNIENAEFAPLKVEAQNFLALLKDDDAKELIEDLAIWQNEPREIFEIVQDIVDIRSKEFQLESENDDINEMYGFCAGIACDNQITLEEVETLIRRLDSYPRVQQDSRIRNLRLSAQRAIADGRITQEESDDICDWITHLVGDSAFDTGLPTFGNTGVLHGALDDFRKITFDGQMFVLTGKFTLGPRKAVSGMIEERGGLTKKAVCKNTSYLAVAAEASRDWRQSHEGLKIMRAIELRDAGHGPELVHEYTLTQALTA
ncbi:hypothetical protein Q669_21510 [Labrenzia sp. C1B10]|uniref:BRCT domain-containing protein n=1 Tax=unclassified Labrenzia TaxID=2648686 RepID=UPI0003B84841|nr:MULTISPECIES: BRCT domain-containing protein [unclassified Labrenzia]ERP97786.1 hypothetical protein Q669_21510 [Labrenzia sp. C1B10]ERS01578.1 hypothetical protein Q675_05625 [Labrenzia sp. C1B70]